MLSTQQKTKALIRLHGSAGWSVPLLFAYAAIYWGFNFGMGLYLCFKCVPLGKAHIKSHIYIGLPEPWQHAYPKRTKTHELSQIIKPVWKSGLPLVSVYFLPSNK